MSNEEDRTPGPWPPQPGPEEILAILAEVTTPADASGLTTLDASSAALHSWYTSLRRAGFTCDEALKYLAWKQP